jgi:uncharacterized protein DUF1153
MSSPICPSTNITRLNNGRAAGRVFGPDGNILTLDTLPPPGTTRWIVRRKAEIVAAVSGGLLSFDGACERYAITPEEFLSWLDASKRLGLKGLRVTKRGRSQNLE